MKSNELALLLDSPIMDIYKLETLLTIWLEAEDNQDVANMIRSHSTIQKMFVML